MRSNTTTLYTDLFAFIGKVGSIYTGDYVKLVLDTSSGFAGDPQTEVDLTVTYDGSAYILMGNVTVARTERTIVAPMQTVVHRFTDDDGLTCEVFKYVQTGVLLQRMIGRMTVQSGNRLDRQDSK